MIDLLIKATKVVAESKTSGPSADSGSSATQKTGEQREGKYAARIQIGYEKDGSPQYRYFHNMADYKLYLENKSSGKQRQRKGKDKDSPEKKSSLERKISKERKQSKEEAGNLKKESKPSKESKKESLLNKGGDGVRLYIGVK